jgi:ABC-2 type transport system permease protein
MNVGLNLSSLRMVWAIAAKDVTDAIRNKTILINSITIVFVVVFYRFLPALESGGELPGLMVYDAGQSVRAAQLESSEAFRTRTATSLEQVQAYVGRADRVRMGIVLPPELDRVVAAGQSPTVDGYIPHWATPRQVEGLRAFYEAELSAWAGVPVQVRTEGNVVYPRLEWGGISFHTSLTLVLALTLTGILTVTHLMLEEKQTRTLQALLVSPASTGQLVAGKALAGAAYCLVAAAGVLVLNATVVTHWGLAILATAGGAALSVALGLLLGSIFQVRQQLMLWGFLLLNVLLVPVFLEIESDLLPEGFGAVLRWVPTVALARTLRLSFANQVPWDALAANLGLVLAGAGLLYLAVGWRIAKMVEGS